MTLSALCASSAWMASQIVHHALTKPPSWAESERRHRWRVRRQHGSGSWRTHSRRIQAVDAMMPLIGSSRRTYSKLPVIWFSGKWNFPGAEDHCQTGWQRLTRWRRLMKVRYTATGPDAARTGQAADAMMQQQMQAMQLEHRTTRGQSGADQGGKAPTSASLWKFTAKAHNTETMAEG